MASSEEEEERSLRMVWRIAMAFAGLGVRAEGCACLKGCRWTWWDLSVCPSLDRGGAGDLQGDGLRAEASLEATMALARESPVM